MVALHIDIKATPKACYQVITDYESYPEFLDEIVSVDVKNKRGNSCEITYHLQVIKAIQYTLKMKGTPHSRVDWTFVGGDFMKDNYGFWDLTEIKKGVTRATYNIEVKFGLLVPNSVTKILVDKNLPATLKAFKMRIEGNVNR